jgi:hypothetical protein
MAVRRTSGSRPTNPRKKAKTLATSHSVSFKAPPDKVWGAVVKTVTAAGYPVAKTDQGARQIIYQASGGGFAWAQNVQVSVTGVDDDETMVSVLVQAAGQQTLTEGSQQRKLISFVVDELSRKFPLSDHQPQTASAPGTSGCFGVAFLLASAAAGSILTVAYCLVR